MALEDNRRELNKLAQESFLLIGDISDQEQKLLERLNILKKKANKLYEELDDRLDND